jgi:hypothetical protein
MGYPLKTSDSKWLEKALELFNKRISFSIIDDAHYNLDKNSDIVKIFKGFSLRHIELIFLGSFYTLSVVCAILFYFSISLQYAKSLGLFLAFSGFIICFGLPTYYLRKNRPPHISQTESGIDIIFGSHRENPIENDISKELSLLENKGNSLSH